MVPLQPFVVAVLVSQEGLSVLRFPSSIHRSLSERIQGNTKDALIPFILLGVVHPVQLWPDNDMGVILCVRVEV